MNKVSLITMLIALIILAFGGYQGWNYYQQMNSTGNKEEAGSSSPPIEATESPYDSYEHDHKHDHEHGNDHIHDDQIPGEKSKIYQLPIVDPLGRRAIGNPNAPIHVQEFFSLTCNHCATFHADVFPAFKEKYVDTGKVYYIFEEFPLNGPALYGSMTARCLPEEQYASFIEILLETQDKWAFSGDFKTSLMQTAKLAGMSEEAFETCFNNKQLQSALATNIKNATENWKLASTPTFIFNDGLRVLRGAHKMEQFDQVYDYLMSMQETEGN